MKIEAQDFLRLTENANTLAFFDIESTGFKGDYNSVIVVSIKPYKSKPYSFQIKQVGNDKKVVADVKAELEKYDCICGYYSKGFDVPMLNTRLLKWGYDPIRHIPHLDMYYTLKYNLLTGRRSQAHLLEWLETPEQKMSVGADVWANLVQNFTPNMRILKQRCESDVTGLQALYERTKHLIKEIKRG